MPDKSQFPPIANEHVFEDFILDLFNLHYPNCNFQPFGKKGNKQKGIDIICTSNGIAIQCKLKELTRKDIIKELKRDFKSDIEKIAEFKPGLQQLIFVSTFADSAQLIEELQKLKHEMSLPFDVTYIGWQSLSAIAERQPEIQKKFFPQYFSPKGAILTSIPFFDIHQLLDRDSIFTNLDTYESKHRVFTIQGIGGSGKTVFLSCYINQNTEKYDNIIWVECSLGSVKESIFLHISFIWNYEDKSKDKWKQFCQKLLSIKGKNVIILDGIEQPEKNIYDLIEDIAATGWQVIVTSRIKLSDYPSLELGGLTALGARQLFCRHYTKPIDDPLLESLLHLMERHPLLVELVAKAGNANKNLSFQDLHKLLSDNKIKSDELQREINVGKHGKKYTENRHQKIYQYLLFCFDISGLDDQEQKQLLYFSVFPASHPIGFGDFIEMTRQSKKQSNSIENAVNRLENNGWISNRNEHYYIHPLIQMVVWEKLGISVDKIEPLVMSCIKQLASSGTTNPWLLTTQISMAKNILQTTELSVESLYLSLLYATMLSNMGSYGASLHHFEQCVAFISTHNITERDFCHMLFNDLGNTYRLVGRYDKAATYLLLAIEISRESDEEDPIGLARTMENYGSVLETMGRFRDAALITREAIEIFRMKGSQRSLCQAYINMANSCYHMGKMEVAKKYWRKGFRLLKADYEPWLVSSCFNTIGIILQAQGRYRLAKEAFIKSIKAHKDSPNPDTLTLLYTNLATSQFHLHQFDKGIRNLEKAVRFNKSIGGGLKHNTAQLNEIQAKYYIYQKNYPAAAACLKAALKIYRELFPGENNDCIRIKENLAALRMGDELYLHRKANDWFDITKEYVQLFNRLLQFSIDHYGIVKGLTSKKSTAVIYDYVFFCVTKSCKTLSVIESLLELGKPEDAQMLLYSVYRNYLSVAYLIRHPDSIEFFVKLPILVANGEIKRPVDDGGVIDATKFTNEKDILPLYPSLSTLLKGIANPEDVIVHNDYLDPQLSDHVYSNFMTSGNYRNAESTWYRYNTNGVPTQPILISAYLQVLLLKEIRNFVNEDKLTRQIDKFINECIPPLSALIEFGNLEGSVKKAMISRIS
jgi:tetratricopeptide (TPR) repeat protein